MAETTKDVSPSTATGPRSVRYPESGTQLSALEMHDNIVSAAEEELERPATSLALSALAAGLVIGFSFLAGAFLAHYTPDHLDHLAVTLVYPLGFILVVRGRNELFTENTFEPIVPLLHQRSADVLRKLLRLWGILLAANLIGTAIFASVMAQTSALPAELRPELMKLAEESTAHPWGLLFYHAIFAGWLIALLTWLLASTHSAGAQIALIWLCTAPIAAFRFKHSIVGSAEAFYRAAAGTASWWDMLAGFTVPTVLGNAVGGVVLVALLNFGQVKEEERRRNREQRGEPPRDDLERAHREHRKERELAERHEKSEHHLKGR